MHLHLDGTNVINAPRRRVFSLLTDSNFLGKTIPDSEDVRVLDGTHLEAKTKVRISVVSSKLNLKMSVSPIDPPSKASLVATAWGSGSNMKISSVFELSGDAPTTMRWSADAEISGVMAGLGSTLLKGFATKKVAEIFGGITQAVEATTG